MAEQIQLVKMLAAHSPMATSEPVVVSYLKLPPEEQPFFGLKEIFEVIRDKLEQLAFTLAEAQNFKEPEPLPPEIEGLMRPLRELASEQCFNVIDIIRRMTEVSGIIMQLLGALPITTSDPAPKIIETARNASGRTATRWAEAEKEMKGFSDEVITTLEKLRVVLDKDKRRASAATVFTKTNSQAVNELLHVVKEACTILRKISGYLRDTERDIQIENLRGLEVPPGEIR